MIKISTMDSLHSQWSAKRQELWQELCPQCFDWVPLPDTTESIIKWGSLMDVLLVGDEHPPELMTQFSSLPEDIRRFHFFDVIFYEGKRVWPRSQKRSALTDLILKKAPALNTQSYAYITGCSDLSRLSVFVLAKMGFKKFKLVTDDSEKLKENLELFQKSLFGVTFEILKDTELTLQPNHGGVLVNTVLDDELIVDLSYLNFIEGGGLIVDLLAVEKPSALLEEARNVRLPCLGGDEVQALADYQLLEKLFEKSPEVQAKLPPFSGYFSRACVAPSDSQSEK